MQPQLPNDQTKIFSSAVPYLSFSAVSWVPSKRPLPLQLQRDLSSKILPTYTHDHASNRCCISAFPRCHWSHHCFVTLWTMLNQSCKISSCHGVGVCMCVNVRAYMSLCVSRISALSPVHAGISKASHLSHLVSAQSGPCRSLHFSQALRKQEKQICDICSRYMCKEKQGILSSS